MPLDFDKLRTLDRNKGLAPKPMVKLPEDTSTTMAMTRTKTPQHSTSLYNKAESMFLFALDNVNTENHKCMALRDSLAVCGPTPDNFMNDVLIERENVQTVMNGVECFTVAEAKGGEKVEVCAPSRKEAHLQMQTLGMQFAKIGAMIK